MSCAAGARAKRGCRCCRRASQPPWCKPCWGCRPVCSPSPPALSATNTPPTRWSTKRSKRLARSSWRPPWPALSMPACAACCANKPPCRQKCTYSHWRNTTTPCGGCSACSAIIHSSGRRCWPATSTARPCACALIRARSRPAPTCKPYATMALKPSPMGPKASPWPRV